MSLRCLAILGSKNEPLYICAAGPNESVDDQKADDKNDISGTSQPEMGEDYFGFFEENDRNDAETEAGKPGFKSRPASIRHEVRSAVYFFNPGQRC